MNDQVTVIRIIQYSGSEAAVRRALAGSLPLGVKNCDGYDITVAEHSSTLEPAVILPEEEVAESLARVSPVEEPVEEGGPFTKALEEFIKESQQVQSPAYPRPQGCICPPPGWQGAWAGICPHHQGLRRGL